jgi:hypothetical protein
MLGSDFCCSPRVQSTTYADADDALTARVEQLEKLIEQKDAEAGGMFIRSLCGTFVMSNWLCSRHRGHVDAFPGWRRDV